MKWIIKIFLNLRKFGWKKFFRLVKSDMKMKVLPAIIRLFYILKMHLKMWTPFLKFSKNNKFYIKDSAKVGYAVRSIAMLRLKDNRTGFVTADVGSDSITCITYYKNRFFKELTIRFPKMSSPIGVQALPSPFLEHSDGIFFCLFNLDHTLTVNDETSVGIIDSVDSLVKRSESKRIVNINDLQPKTVFSRKGCWGFRGVKTYAEEDGTVWAATIDRSEDLFCVYMLTGTHSGKWSMKRVAEIDLGYKDYPAEPVSIATIPSTIKNGDIRFCVTQRGKNEITIIRRHPENRFLIENRFSVPGASRSSSAVGCFRSKDRIDVAIALWGGDPKDLRSIVKGQFVMLLSDADGKFVSKEVYPGGVHPTDITAGDFDGDGMDEIALLNFGAGLTPLDRFHPGNIQIFKYIDSTFIKIDEIYVPYPRVAIASDIDNDGKDELIVSLFYEQRIVVVKSLL